MVRVTIRINVRVRVRFRIRDTIMVRIGSRFKLGLEL